MTSIASRIGVTVAASAAAMSMFSAVFVPYGRPGPGYAWAVLASAAGLWVLQRSQMLAPRTSDVIHDVEAGPLRPSGAWGCGLTTTGDIP